MVKQSMQSIKLYNSKQRKLLYVLVCLTWLLCMQALAHDARPVVVNINEALPDIFQAEVKVPPTVSSDNLPLVLWPSYCEPADSGATDRALMRCASGMAGQVLALDYPQFNPSLATFFRVTALDGSESTALLAPSDDSWRVPEAMTAARVAGNYLLLGIEHIIGGLDHLLFVLGLLVIARTPRRILLTVTGFTLAHSITLSLSSLGLLSLPIVPVEAAIALSILFLAHEIGQQHKDSLTWRYPLLVSFGFGLLHGLGFASALGEIGLLQNEVLLSLLFFNLGVETGQILFILLIMALVWLLNSLAGKRSGNAGSEVLVRRTDMVAAYVIGVPAAYWFIDRVAQFLL